MFKINKRKMIVPGGSVKYQSGIYEVVLIASSVTIKDKNGRNQNVNINNIEPIINKTTLEKLINESNNRINSIQTKIHQMDRLKSDDVDKYTIMSSEIIEISSSDTPNTKKLEKIKEILKNIKHFENGDKVRITSNRKQKLKIGSEWRIKRASNPLVLVDNSGGQQHNVYKSEVETIGEKKSELIDEKKLAAKDLDIYQKIHDYLIEEEVDEFDDGHYLSWYIVNIMNSEKRDSEKTREIAKVLNSSLNKINIDVLKQM